MPARAPTRAGCPRHETTQPPPPPAATFCSTLRPMTRVAIISDVHADLHALTDALAQADRMGCQAVLCAGDLVDSGQFPNETIALLRERGIPCIRGNHDRWQVAKQIRRRVADADGGSGTDLTPETLQFLAALPIAWNGTFDDVRLALRHGTPHSDMDGIYPGDANLADAERWLAEAEASVLLVGHTHQPFAMTTPSGGLIANPGALLRSEPIRRHSLSPTTSSARRTCSPPWRPAEHSACWRLHPESSEYSELQTGRKSKFHGSHWAYTTNARGNSVAARQRCDPTSESMCSRHPRQTISSLPDSRGRFVSYHRASGASSALDSRECFA